MYNRHKLMLYGNYTNTVTVQTRGLDWTILREILCGNTYSKIVQLCSQYHFTESKISRRRNINNINICALTTSNTATCVIGLCENQRKLPD
jgi:hypothetical protein